MIVNSFCTYCFRWQCLYFLHNDFAIFQGFGPNTTICKGQRAQMMSTQQWEWLDKEMSKTSVIKVIGSSIQVLPPLSHVRDNRQLCSHDMYSNSGAPQNPHCIPSDTTDFCKAVFDVGEDIYSKGTWYESWSLMPHERRKLLQKAQLAINKGHAKIIIFASGDQHWGEIMKKKMPQIPGLDGEEGRPQTLYEVTASGIYQNWPEDILNSNRFSEVPGCEEAFSNLTTICTKSKYHTCSSKSNYGQIDIDFDGKYVKLSIRTPIENEEASVKIKYDHHT